MRRKVVAAAIVTIAIAVCVIALAPDAGPATAAGPPAAKAPGAAAGKKAPGKKAPGKKAPDKKAEAPKAGKHTFLFFHKGDAGNASAMRKLVESAAAKLKGKAEVKAIDTTDDSSKGLLLKYRIDPARTPMPLVLVQAPNGAIVNSFAVSFREKDLIDSLAGPRLADCFKALQEGKLVLVCAQNAQTKANAAAMKGVTDFKADSKYAKITRIVTVDPKDKAEKRLLSQLQISPDVKEAVTVMLAPPGKLAGRFVGATDKDKLAAALAACGAGCASPG